MGRSTRIPKPVLHDPDLRSRSIWTRVKRVKARSKQSRQIWIMAPACVEAKWFTEIRIGSGSQARVERSNNINPITKWSHLFVSLLINNKQGLLLSECKAYIRAQFVLFTLFIYQYFSMIFISLLSVMFCSWMGPMKIAYDEMNLKQTHLSKPLSFYYILLFDMSRSHHAQSSKCPWQLPKYQ